MDRRWKGVMVKGTISGTNLLMQWSCMPMVAERPMDG
jgi:hypothetical protein